MRVQFLFILPLIKLSMISIDYTSYQTKISKSLISQKCDKMKNLIQPDLSTTKIFRYDTIFYPLDMMEDSTKKNFMEDSTKKNLMEDSTKRYINYSLHKSEEDVLIDDEPFYRINGYETKMTAFDLNALFLHLIWEQTRYKNIEISVRDYYQKDMVEKLVRSLNLEYGTNLLIIPASLSVVSDFASCDGGEGVYLIVSMVGYQTVFNIYEVTRKNTDKNNQQDENKEQAENNDEVFIEIKTIYTKSCDLLGDSILDNIICKNVRMTLNKPENKNNEFVLHVLPLENIAEFKETDYFLDIIDICEEIKTKLAYNVEEHSIKDSYIYNMKGSKALLKEISFNLQDIRNEFEEYATIISENILFIKKEIDDILIKHPISKKFVISSFEISVVNNILKMENLKNIQEKFIVDGAMKFILKKMMSDDVRIIKHESTYRKTPVDKLLEEINAKKTYIKKITEIKNKKGFSEYLPHIPAKNLPSDKYLVDDVALTDLKDKECLEFLKLIKKLEDDNYKIEKSIKMRPLQVKKAEDILDKVLKIKSQNIEVWNMGLGKRYENFRLFLDTNKDNMDILGQDIEYKADMLEGLVESYTRSYENKKKIEEEKLNKKEESNKAEEVKDQDKETEEVKNQVKETEEVKNQVKETEEVKDQVKGKEAEENNERNVDPAKMSKMKEELKNMMKDEKFSDLMKDLEEQLKKKGVANPNDIYNYKDNVNPEEEVKTEKEL